MYKILVPTDFSPFANNALEYALSLAKEFGSVITIAHAFESTNPILNKLDSRIEREAYKEAENKLSHLKESVNVNHPEISCTTHIEIAYPVAMVYDLSNTANYDLIVMGTHGATRSIGLEGAPVAMEYGSVTSSLVGEINIPILAIHENDQFVKPTEFILLSDLQNMPSPDSYNFLRNLASKFDAKVNILYIESKPSSISDAFEEMNDFEKIFEGIEYEYNVVKQKDVEQAILNMIIDKNQLLTVIAKEKSTLQNMFGQSTSKYLANYFSKTLLVLPEYITIYSNK